MFKLLALKLASVPIIVLLFLILVAILAGFYYWYTIVMSEQVVTETGTRPTAEQNNEPESTTAEARTGLMDVVSTSDELDAIALSLNTRPRARLGFESPLVVYTQHIALLQHPTNTVN